MSRCVIYHLQGRLLVFLLKTTCFYDVYGHLLNHIDAQNTTNNNTVNKQVIFNRKTNGPPGR